MATYAARLALVSAAIDAILTGGQDVTYEGRRVTFADLAQLQALEESYSMRAQRESRGGGIRIRGGTPV